MFNKFLKTSKAELAAIKNETNTDNGVRYAKY